MIHIDEAHIEYLKSCAVAAATAQGFRNIFGSKAFQDTAAAGGIENRFHVFGENIT